MQYLTLEACRAALACVVLAMDEDQVAEIIRRVHALLDQSPPPEPAADPPADG